MAKSVALGVRPAPDTVCQIIQKSIYAMSIMPSRFDIIQYNNLGATRCGRKTVTLFLITVKIGRNLHLFFSWNTNWSDIESIDKL